MFQHDIKELKKTILEKDIVIEISAARIALLEEIIRAERQKRFGASSEKDTRQAELFNEIEVCAEEAETVVHEVTTPAATSHHPVKAKTGRKPLPKDLPRIKEQLYLSEIEKAGALRTFFVFAKEELDIVPAQIRVIEYYQEKAVFPDGMLPAIKAAPLPKHPIPRAIGSVGLMAYLIVGKYADGLPLYRLEKILNRHGANVSRATLANWMIRLSQQLQPIINLLRDCLLAGPVIYADETPLQVLKEKDKNPSSKSYMWVQVGGDKTQPIVLFDYDASRSKQVPLRLFEGYHGYLHTDGYAAYGSVCQQENITQLGCWDHVRRKFVEAKKAEPKKKGKQSPASKADMAISLIQKLYVIERQIKDLNEHEIQQHRQQKSLPVLEKIKVWMEKTLPQVPKDALTGKALSYMQNQWSKLVVYCDDGRLNISNCRAENAIRPFVIGRKAWLFSDTPNGAHASAILYSLIETAKLNKVEPYHYFRYILENIMSAQTVEDYEALLPWNTDSESVPRLK